MKIPAEKITLEQWEERYKDLCTQGMKDPSYGGPLGRHVKHGDLRIQSLKFDNSPAALDLWNFLLTEEERLHQDISKGYKLVGTMKDLGTIPVMAYSLPNVKAFYPDGAWWIPCIMELSAGLLEIADKLGVNDSFCPVRAMLGAFMNKKHFPIPDLLICSAGATCDDFSAIAQRVEYMGHPIFWWEIPARRDPEPDESSVMLPGGFVAPALQISLVKKEMERIREVLEHLADTKLDDIKLAQGIRKANQIRRLLRDLRHLVYKADLCPLPALEMQIAEMLAIHFCSDQGETLRIYRDLVREVKRRIKAGEGILGREAIKIYWINPVADIKVMNILEECGGRLCGTEFLFCHALDEIPENIPPLEALSRMALADPMAGPTRDRAERICQDIREFGAEAVVISRIPGASHCAFEGHLIKKKVLEKFEIPVTEIEVPPLCDSFQTALQTRIEALVESVKTNRRTFRDPL